MQLIITDGGGRYWDERITGWTTVRENATRYSNPIDDCPAYLEVSDEEIYYGDWDNATEEHVTYIDDNGHEAWTTEA